MIPSVDSSTESTEKQRLIDLYLITAHLLRHSFHYVSDKSGRHWCYILPLLAYWPLLSLPTEQVHFQVKGVSSIIYLFSPT